MPQGFFPSLLSILTDLLWIKEAVACGGTGRKEQHKMVRGLVSNGCAKEQNTVSMYGYNLNIILWLCPHVSPEQPQDRNSGDGVRTWWAPALLWTPAHRTPSYSPQPLYSLSGYNSWTKFLPDHKWLEAYVLWRISLVKGDTDRTCITISGLDTTLLTCSEINPTWRSLFSQWKQNFALQKPS